MALSPTSRSGSVVTLTVQSNGKVIPDHIALIAVKVDTALAGTSRAVLVIADGDAAEGDFPVSNSDTFEPGAAIRIAAGYDGRESVIFEGVVVKHGITSSRDGSSLVVECQDPTAAMTLEHSKEVTPPDTPASPVLTVTWGVDLIAFEAAIDLRLHPSSMKERVPVRTNRAASPWSRGRMTFQGCVEPRVGSMIELLGVGNRFSGNVLVSAVCHRIEEGDWTTEAEFGLDGNHEEQGTAGRTQP